MRGGRWTKPPISPHTGRYANVTDPQDWGTRDEAETAVTALLNGKGSGGIGIVLGDLDGDVFLAGIDFDACVDQNNCLALWAERLLAEIDSYAERSPSGTGVKSFFHVTAKDVRWFLDLIGVKPDSWGTSRSIPGEKPKKDHGPGFEIYFGQRYFTITADRWLGKPAQVHLLDRAVLQRLATLIGKPGPGSGGRDNSRSAKAFREALELRRAGKIKTFEEMRQTLLSSADPQVAEWTRTKGRANNLYHLRLIWEKTAQDADENGLPIITVEAGERHVAADQGIAALVCAKVEFYQRNRQIQRVALVKAKNTSGETMMVPGIVPVGLTFIGRELGRNAFWRRFNGRSKRYVRIDPPTDVAAQILGMVGSWPFASLERTRSRGRTPRHGQCVFSGAGVCDR